MLRWIGRHGVVTPLQVAHHFFTRVDGSYGQWAAYRRLRKLEELQLIRHDRTFWRESNVLRLTSAGARLADADVGPAHLILAEVRHSLAVVDLVDMLLASSPKGTTVRTERELRIERRRALADGSRKAGRGRIPDAVLISPKGMTVAIELDITPKRTRDLERVLNAYRQERFDHIIWFVAPKQRERVAGVVKSQRVEDLVEVRAWEALEVHQKT